MPFYEKYDDDDSSVTFFSAVSSYLTVPNEVWFQIVEVFLKINLVQNVRIILYIKHLKEVLIFPYNICTEM